MRKSKVLFRMYDLKPTGGTFVADTFFEYFDFSRYTVTLLTNWKDDQILEKPYAQQVDYRYFFSHRSRSLPAKVVQKLLLNLLPSLLYRRLFKKADTFDVEIDFSEHLTFSGGLATRRWPRVLWLHNDIFQSYRFSSLRLFVMRRFREIVSVSPNLQEKLLDSAPHLKERSRVILNPVVREKIEKKAQESPGFSPSEDLILLGMGRLSTQKRFDRFIRAHASLKERGIASRLYLIGEGDERENLLSLIQSLDVSETVTLMGFLPNPYPYLASCDLFGLSSQYEGYGLVLAEALILGRPVISTDVVGARDNLAGGKYGKIVANTDDAFIEGICELVLNKKECERFKERSEEAKKRYSYESSLKALERVLDELTPL